MCRVSCFFVFFCVSFSGGSVLFSLTSLTRLGLLLPNRFTFLQYIGKVVNFLREREGGGMGGRGGRGGALPLAGGKDCSLLLLCTIGCTCVRSFYGYMIRIFVPCR